MDKTHAACVCVGMYGLMSKLVCVSVCTCVFVWNLISASGPMALVCLHPKSKRCNYDDRPVLFISHLSLSLSLCFRLLHLSISVFILLSLWPVRIPSVRWRSLNNKTVTDLVKLLALSVRINSCGHSRIASPWNVCLSWNDCCSNCSFNLSDGGVLFVWF